MKKIVKVKELINNIIDLATESGNWQIHEKAKQLNALINDDTIITNKNKFEYDFDNRYKANARMILVAKKHMAKPKQKYCDVCNQEKIAEYFGKIKEKMIFDLQEEIENENS